MAKKKKKKKSTGARKSSYAMGKRVESELENDSSVTRRGKDVAVEPASAQWNIVRRGTLEMKVFLALIAVLTVAALFQYPLAIQDATTYYNKLKKEYPAALEKFKEKYETPAEQKKHSREKPIQPRKPVFADFLVYQALFLVIQGALFAFVGLNVQRRTDLKTPLLDKVGVNEAGASDLRDLLSWSVPFGIAALVPPLISTFIGKSLGFIQGVEFRKMPAWKFSLSYINIAISNEILFTFLVFSAFVYFFSIYRERLKVGSHMAAIAAASALCCGYIYWISVAAGEKPATAAMSAVFLALSLVTVLGYLYWRKGLEYSLLAGAIGFGLYPFLARVIVR
ncbi:MAG: hypothetical protein CVT63_05550 [Candidatus Anoxymicrobium japonicum]|uniref:Uncharacterized protein n=1 Tax=Candidatus Anoxymicrobium japonicum TaxID=2013648 RepID=A0A2N3G597_9ACTN|nr:MAG: hypothetical protein CVT63_05550 [Candidatus Anoxymicrobium japonicum]